MTVPFDAEKLAGLMAEAHIDLVLGSSRHNVRYLTGGYAFHFKERIQRAGSSQYLALVGVPRGVEGAFYVGSSEEELGFALDPIWIERKALVGIGNVAEQSAAAATLAQASIARAATIGVELPFLPAQALATLRERMPDATFVDVTDLLHELRAIKTDAELAILRDVTEQVVDSALLGFSSAYEGVTTREIARTIERDMGGRGLTFLWAFTNAGPGFLRTPSATRWERGRLLHLDCGGLRDDYVGDICRMGSLGEPSALGRELVDAGFAVQNAIRRQVRSGLRYGDVNEIATAALGQTPFAAIGRVVVHGLGMVSHEQPMINVPTQAGRCLEVGHVLSIETDLRHPDEGHVKIEETVAVTPGGIEGFGDLGRALQIVVPPSAHDAPLVAG